MTWVKICGIQSYQEALWAIESEANALGFIFVPNSKRYISPQIASQIIQQLPSTVKTVGVFVNEKPGSVATIAKECSLDMIQLHGQENIEDYDQIPLPKIKAFSLSIDLPSTTNSSTSTTPYAPAREILAHYRTSTHTPWGILLDAAHEKAVGGTGKILPWQKKEFQDLLQEIKSIGLPLILAGGLTTDNVLKAIHYTQPFGVDVSTGVEEKGRKSKGKIQDFLAKVKTP